MASQFIAVANGTLFQLKLVKQNALVEITGKVYAGNVYQSDDHSVIIVEEQKQLDVIPIEALVESQNGQEKKGETQKQTVEKQQASSLGLNLKQQK